MKTINILYISLIITFFAIIPTNAQNSVMSGSFQFINSDNRVEGSIILQSGTQKFEFQITENIVVANLLPGHYTLIVEMQSSGRGARTTRQQENCYIESNKRIVCHCDANSNLFFTKETDRNSISIFINMDSRVISDENFNRLCNAIRSDKFTNTKKQTLKVLSNSYQFFTSEQVKSLALLFSFDDDRLECVKYLVPKVIDTQNLQYIENVFIFDSTKTTYLQFLISRSSNSNLR